MKKIAWFSCGVTSAVATKIALDQYKSKNVEIIYMQIDSAHEDNERFIAECEDWYKKKIVLIRNKKGYLDQFDVIEKTKYINGPFGARCTLELKKQARYEWEDAHEWSNQTFGMEFNKKEINRALRLKDQHPNTRPIFPLIDAQLTKSECHGILQLAGIKQPRMYDLGFPNNNCIGCVKGGQGYWSAIKEHFPNHFDRMAALERKIGATCLKDSDSNRIYLDNLDVNKGRKMERVVPDCGMFCQLEFEHLIDRKTNKILAGDINI